MKNLIITKHHPCVQLAHLYEHIFIDKVSEILYQRGQYKFLDYAINGTTYESGVILISAEAYNDSTRRFLKQLLSMKIDLDNEKPGYPSVVRAMLQLFAEEDSALFVDNNEAIRELKKLDASPWQNLDDVDLLTPKSSEYSGAICPIYATDQPAEPPRKLVLQLRYQNYNEGLLPLWHQLAYFLSLSIGQKVCHNFCTYFTKRNVAFDGKSVVLDSIFLSSPQTIPAPTNEAVMRIARKTLEDLTTGEVKERFVNYLQAVSYSEDFRAAPDLDQMLRDIGIVAGSAGWQRIATIQNVEAVLSNLSIDLKVY